MKQSLARFLLGGMLDRENLHSEVAMACRFHDLPNLTGLAIAKQLDEPISTDDLIRHANPFGEND
jgi:hypothetical protein